MMTGPLQHTGCCPRAEPFTHRCGLRPGSQVQPLPLKEYCGTERRSWGVFSPAHIAWHTLQGALLTTTTSRMLQRSCET
jgi:hypothetical protein